MNSDNQKYKWCDLTHHEKYMQLHENRLRHCRNAENLVKEDVSGGKYFLNGECIRDLPSFYLALGEAINGDNGYFGTCLDSLDDCLGGGFGIELPIEINIFNGKGVEDRLSERAWLRMHLENRLSLIEDENVSIEELKEWEVFELTGESFFKALGKLFEEENVKFRLYD